MAANWSNWIKPQHIGIYQHDVCVCPWMMGQTGADGSVDDVVMSEIPWFVSGAVGSTLPYGTQKLIPTYNLFSLPKQHPPITICDMDNGQQHYIIHQGASELTQGHSFGASRHHDKHGVVALFYVSKIYIGKKGHCQLADISHFC
jgi:hypothetical protein